MKISPIKDAPRFLGFIFFALTLILACSKDADEPYEMVDAASTSDSQADSDENKSTKLTAKTTETLTTSFAPIQDAYVQSGQGYDQKIVRLEDGRRKSYLMFDLSEIESNEGSLVSVDLEFTISSDGGNGTVSIFQGKAGSWSEDNLSASSAPVAEALLAKTTDDYKVGQTKKIRLDSDQLTAGIITLVMTHQDGNDLAFASKEHPDVTGPKLIVSYNAEIGADAANNDESNNEASKTSENNPIEAVISGLLPSSAKAPVKVNFKAWNSKNQGDITSYFWDFKDGSTTTTKNPSHTFSEPGEYSVSLTVKNKEGFTHSTSYNITITGSASQTGENGDKVNATGSENINITAVISGSIPTRAQAPRVVDFKAWNSKNQQDITGYFWDFKDGSTTTVKNPSHTFKKPGVYNVELSVKNSAGQIHSTTRSIEITSSSTTSSGSTGGGSGSSTSGSSGGSSSSSGSGSGSTSGDSSGSNTSGNYPSNAVFASDFGFRSGDATAAFEAAIKSGSSYVVIDKQSSDWVIRPTRFFDLRDMTIVFEPGVTVRAKSGAYSNGARMFKLTRADNVTIEGSGATLRMNKGEYGGQQHHALEINVSNDVTVRGLTIRDSGGDGVHISGQGDSRYSQNITLENIRSTNNKRSGITIISAQDVWIRNSEFSNSSGSSPESGVTLETDASTERLSNINFIGCKFKDNDKAGFHFSTNQMNGGSRSVSVKVVDSEFSNNMVSPSGPTTAEIYLGGGQTNNPVGGEIRFERIKFNGSRNRIIFTRKSSTGYQAVFKDCDANNVVSSASNSPIRMEAHASRNTLGGIRFDNFDIQYNRDVPFMHINAPRTFTVKNVSGSFDIQEPNDNPLRYSGGYRSSANQNVSVDYDHN